MSVSRCRHFLRRASSCVGRDHTRCLTIFIKFVFARVRRKPEVYNFSVRYLVTARVKPGRHEALERSIEEGTLGRGSVAGDEYLRNMAEARQLQDGSVQWVE